jgi:glycerophosphoryl diester phosphodiesterase
VVESTLPAFAWGLILGATTLEMDNGITKDGVVVVWHDEEIKAEKCVDTMPVKMIPISLMLARILSISLWLR